MENSFYGLVRIDSVQGVICNIKTEQTVGGQRLLLLFEENGGKRKHIHFVRSKRDFEPIGVVYLDNNFYSFFSVALHTENRCFCGDRISGLGFNEAMSHIEKCRARVREYVLSCRIRRNTNYVIIAYKE